MTEVSPRPLRVFLCHSSGDKPATRALYHLLIQSGVDAWLDEKKLLPGQNWRQEIPKAVQEADAVIVLLSQDSTTKEGYVQKEIKFALDVALEKPEGTIYVIPARLEQCDVPRSLSDWQWVDLFFDGENFNDEEYIRLLHSLQIRAEHVGAVRPTSSKEQGDRWVLEAQHKKDYSKRNLSSRVVVAIIGILVTIGVGIFAIPKLVSLFAVPPETLAVTGTIVPFSESVPTIEFTPTVTYTPTETSKLLLPTEQPTATSYPPTIVQKGVKMVLVPAGEFIMGSEDGNDDEKPEHTVYLDTFYIDTYEVTNMLYRMCVDSEVCVSPKREGSYTRSSYFSAPSFDKYPVILVDWNMAKTYCEWQGARLPTEAEWEKAARDADGRTYPWGEGIEKTYANFFQYVGDTTIVGNYKYKSKYGAYDMAGNVKEWVADWYAPDYYVSSPASNPPGPQTGSRHVVRGGAWDDFADNVRSAARSSVNSTDTFGNVGFRCAYSP
jgi:formylglycine-generating enzyme required for sulfatase activity